MFLYWYANTVLTSGGVKILRQRGNQINWEFQIAVQEQMVTNELWVWLKLHCL